MGSQESSTTSAGPVGIGVIGLGFMGSTHVRAYMDLARREGSCVLIAAADKSAERLTGKPVGAGNLGSAQARPLFDPREVRGYFDPRELLGDPRVQAVSICTHTDTHVDLGVAALSAGKHVLVEKPVALKSADVRRLRDAAKSSGKICMPAMCMRFWPGWAFVHEAIKSNAYGPVQSATIQRLGTAPDWADFYRDTTRSGGALVDLHIHDTDFVRWCFGQPSSVVTVGTQMHVTTMYRYGAGGPAHVVAEGAQDYAQGFGFVMRFVMAFEKATLDFDLSRLKPLVKHQDGASTPVELPAGTPATGYDGEIEQFVKLCRGEIAREAQVVTMDDAVKTAELLEAEAKSMTSGSAVVVG